MRARWPLLVGGVLLLPGCLSYNDLPGGDLSGGDLALHGDLAALVDLAQGPACTPSDSDGGFADYLAQLPISSTGMETPIELPGGILPSDIGVAFMWSTGTVPAFSPQFEPVMETNVGTDIQLHVATITGIDSDTNTLSIGASSAPYYIALVFYPHASCIVPQLATTQTTDSILTFAHTDAPAVDLVFAVRRSATCAWQTDSNFSAVVTDNHDSIASAFYEHFASPDEPATFDIPSSCPTDGGAAGYYLAALQLVH